MDENGYRNVVDVTLQILEFIPATETSFLDDIQYLLEGFAYNAPETRYLKISWNKLDIVINKHITDVRNPWKKKVIETYIGKSIDEYTEATSG